MFLNPWELLAHLWHDVSGALTWRGSATIVPALLLPYFVWRKGWTRRPFFSGWAMVLLTAAYLGLPSMLSNWNYLNCRLVPFLWAGLLVQLPSRLPRAVAGLLVVSALAFSVALGVDYARLDRDRAAFTAGIDAVPERATLLPLLFKHGEAGGFTASLTHAWGYYTVAKDTSAPLVFAVDRFHPINYRHFPPGQLIPPALDGCRRALWHCGPHLQGAQAGPDRGGLLGGLARSVGQLLARGRAAIQPPARLGHADGGTIADPSPLPLGLRGGRVEIYAREDARAATR